VHRCNNGSEKNVIKLWKNVFKKFCERLAKKYYLHTSSRVACPIVTRLNE